MMFLIFVVLPVPGAASRTSICFYFKNRHLKANNTPPNNKNGIASLPITLIPPCKSGIK
jgi:hypothetical protein